jgi:hypothetical protein
MDTSSIVAFVLWAASAGAFGVVTTFVMQQLKRWFPDLAELRAKVAAIVVAALFSIAATVAVPYLGRLPSWANQAWTILILIISQLKYADIKARALKSGDWYKNS